VELFLNTLRGLTPYPKVRQLNNIFKNKLDKLKVHLILRYLERSKALEVDLQGNIIWMKVLEDRRGSLRGTAKFSPEFKEFVKEFDIDLSSESDST
jgi:hypothetical protein